MRLLAVVGASLVTAAAAAAATTPAQLYKDSLLAARAQQSVHYVSTSALGATHERMVGDAARDRGTQRIAFTQGGRTGHVTVIVVADTAYVRGDAFTLKSYMGLTTGQASRYAGRWFFLKPPSGAYRVVAEAVTLDSFVAELAMPAPYAAVGSHAVRSTVTRSGQTATVTLYVAASGKPLPVRQVATGSTGTITTVMSAWNERVVLSAPSGAVAFH